MFIGPAIRTKIILVTVPILLIVGLSYYRKFFKFPRIDEVSVTSSVGNKSEIVTLPYLRLGKPKEILKFQIPLTYHDGQASVFLVVPDDCLDEFKVNDLNVTLDDKASARRCDWQKGFLIDLQPYLKDGTNNVFIKVSNKYGNIGLKFSPRNVKIYKPGHKPEKK